MENQTRPITTLVAVDLDGTLLTSDKKVSEKTKEAIRELKEHGILFGIVSGRPVESGLILCEGWGIQDSISFLIGMNGGVLYDVRRKEKETYSIIPGHTIWKIIEAYHDMPTLHFEVMVGNKRYVQYSTPETLANAELFGEEEIIVDLEAFLENHNVNKLVIRSTEEEQPRVKEIGDQIKIPGVIGFSTSNVLYEFVDPDINKGYGLYKVCDHFGLNLNNVVAFGDENNDVQMLMTAGTGVAMKNALPGVKAICDVVSEYTNDEDAIAHYINEVILPQQQEKVER